MTNTTNTTRDDEFRKACEVAVDHLARLTLEISKLTLQYRMGR